MEAPFKDEYRRYLNLKIRKVKESNIDLRMNTFMSPEDAKAFGADVVILAIGAHPIKPPFPGADLPMIHTIDEVRSIEVGKNVVIIGGGPQGAEEGLVLQQEGKSVTVVEMRDQICLGAPYLHYTAVNKEYLKEGAPKALVNSKCISISSEGVLIENVQTGEQTLCPADMDGWQTWAMRDVSVAVYHATRSQFASGDDKWRKLLDHLKGKEITSAGHLSAQNFSFGEEIIELDGKLNFYLQADFDVDAAFGTFVCTDQNDDWLNIYANYDVEQDRLCNTLDLNLCKGDGSEENWSYPLNAAEQEVLLCKMEAFCQQQTGMSLHEYAQQLRDM